MIRVTVQGGDRLIITGLPDAPRGTVRAWLEDVAEIVESRIAADFARERGAGRALVGNSRAYNERKAFEGLMAERGHATGNLQNELDAGGFYRIGPVSRGRAVLFWREDDLAARVDYAGYYAEAKVRGGKLLVVLAKDATEAARYLADVADDWETRQRRKAS